MFISPFGWGSFFIYAPLFWGSFCVFVYLCFKYFHLSSHFFKFLYKISKNENLKNRSSNKDRRNKQNGGADGRPGRSVGYGNPILLFFLFLLVDRCFIFVFNNISYRKYEILN